MLSMEAVKNITDKISDKVIASVTTDDEFQHTMCELLDKYIEQQTGPLDEVHRSEIAMQIYQQFEATLFDDNIWKDRYENLLRYVKEQDTYKPDYTIDLTLPED